MIWDTLERVNKLRKEAMEDPEFWIRQKCMSNGFWRNS